MSCPLIRPEDVGHLSRRQIDRLLQRLDEECHAAGVRHREILRARRMREIRESVRRDPDADEHAAPLRAPVDLYNAGRKAAERAERLARRATERRTA